MCQVILRWRERLLPILWASGVGAGRFCLCVQPCRSAICKSGRREAHAFGGGRDVPSLGQLEDKFHFASPLKCGPHLYALARALTTTMATECGEGEKSLLGALQEGPSWPAHSCSLPPPPASPKSL